MDFIFCRYFPRAILLTTATLLIGASQPSLAALRVLIDPGHGGIDQGAVYGKIQEAKITLDIALQLQEMLKSDARFSPRLTRDKNKTVSLQDRVQMIQENQADVLISLHGNASPERKAQGLEIYFQNQNTISEQLWSIPFEKSQLTKKITPTIKNETLDLKKSADIQGIIADLKQQSQLKKSYQLAEHINEDWPGVIKQAPFYVISHSQIPSILVEVGFVSHPIEGPRLAERDSQKTIAEKIYKALVKYASYHNQDSVTLSQNSVKK